MDPNLLSVVNKSGSTPLHWAAVNSHLTTVQKLVNFPRGPHVLLIDFKNSSGRTPLGEAEMAGWDEGARWMVSVMNLEKPNATDGEPEEHEDEIAEGDVEIEIEDAEGEIARMNLGASAQELQDQPRPGAKSPPQT